MKKILLPILFAGLSLLSCTTDDEAYNAPEEATGNFENVVYAKEGEEPKDSLPEQNQNVDGDPPPKDKETEGLKQNTDNVMIKTN